MSHPAFRLLLASALLCFGASPEARAQAGDRPPPRSESPPTAGPREYSGPYRLGDLSGRVTFGYRLDGGDTVLVGPFRFRAYDAAALLGEGDRYADIVGEFAGGRPVGPWRFDFGSLRAADVTEVRDLRYHLAVDGRHRRVEGAFRDGRPEGAWVTTTEEVRRSRPTDTLFRSELTFVDGRPQRTFRLQGAGAELLGLISRDGVAEDTWTLLDGHGGQEDWRFADGRLVTIATTVDGRTAETTVFEPMTADTAHVQLDGDYLRTLYTYLELAGRDGGAVSRGRTALLLREDIAAYEEVAAALSGLTEVDLAPHITVVVPSVPLAAQAVDQLGAISAGLARFEAQSEALLSDATVRIVATTDDEVARLRAAAQALHDDFAAPLRRLDTSYRAGVLARVPLTDYLAMMWPEGGADAELDLSYVGASGRQRGTYRGPGAAHFDVRAAGLGGVEAMVAYAEAALADIRAQLAARVTTAEAGALTPEVNDTGGEPRLKAALARLDSLLATVPRRRARDLGLDAVAALSRERRATYGKLDGLGRQRERPALIACTDDLYALGVQLKALPLRVEQVREAYTDEVWNNMIATVMEERVKKRLTHAYEDVLVPYYLDRVRGELGCGTAGAVAAGLDELHARMLALRDDDTAALEERLRNTDEPRAVLALLTATPLN